MDDHLLKIPCNAMPFVCETDYSVTFGGMIHADRTAPFHVVIYLLQGAMEIIEDDIVYQIMPHQLFFLKSGVHHWGVKPFEQGSAWYYAHFYCDGPTEQMDELPTNVYYDRKVCLDRRANEKYITVPKLTDCAGTDRIRRNFERLVEAHVHGNIPQASILLWQMILESARSVKENTVENGYVKKIQEYVKNHCTDGFTSKDIEEICGLSYKYAGTLFKKTTGQTIKEYECAARLRKAERLLAATDKPITEIARLTGFSDVFYFSKVFHRKKGCAPREYRREYVPRI